MKCRPLWNACFVLVAVFLSTLFAVAAVPGDSPSAVEQSNAPTSACSVQITSTLLPPSLLLCETADVSVTMAITCPASLPIHLVIAVDRSGSIADVSGNNFLADIKTSARAVIDAVDLAANPENKVAVLSHGFRVIRETDLTNDPSRALGAVNGIRYIASDIGETPPEALREATRMLVNARTPGFSPIEIILLYGDGCDPSEAGCPAQTRSAAGAAGGAGITVMTMCYANSPRSSCQNYRVAASTNGDYFENNSSQVDDRVKTHKQRGVGLKLKSLQLVEVLGAGIELVPGSASPVPALVGQNLTFRWSDVSAGSMPAAGYRVRGRAVGAVPLRAATGSGVTFVDSMDRAAPLLSPANDTLTVSGPCLAPTPTASAATPTSPPTATSTDSATATPTATPTDLPPTVIPTATPTLAPSPSPTPWIRRAYLPLALRHVCKRAEVHTDVLLAIDSSNSMLELSGGVAKVDAAKAAATRFIELLTPADQAAIVTFNQGATLLVPLSSDRAALAAAIASIRTAAGTRIDLALEKARLEMTSDRLRAGNNRVVVLMTDGFPDPGTADAVRQAAAELKATGVFLYTIGLGDSVDAALLTEIATSPATFIPAPAASDLQRIYESVAYALPCPGGAFWESR